MNKNDVSEPIPGQQLALHCPYCGVVGEWRIDRFSDGAESWACPEHLSAVCLSMQRDNEVTELAVRLSGRLWVAKSNRPADPRVCVDLNSDGAGAIVVDGVNLSSIITEVAVHLDVDSAAITVTVLVLNGRVTFDGRQVYSSDGPAG